VLTPTLRSCPALAVNDTSMPTPRAQGAVVAQSHFILLRRKRMVSLPYIRS